MEKLSPPVSSSPSSASGQSSTAKLPTYTTAGTIYNPNSTQPLQPPARRARSLKWTTGGAYSDLSLLPRSLLATLPTKYPSNPRGTPAVQPAPQYTPLQQNYERALNPLNRLDYMADEMSPRSLPASSDNPSPRPPGQLHHDLEFFARDAENDGDDEDENEDESIDNIMMNMTVKSLHNLASYPNPNQKKAQKALLRPVKPRPNLGAQATSNFDAIGQPYWRPSLKTQQDYAHMPRNSLRHSYSDSSTMPAATSALNLHQDASQRDAYWSTARLAKPPSTIGDIAEQPSWVGSHTLGSGLPRPLTAGPPGQRQYRPSTFESTFKALQTNSRLPVRNSDDDVYFMGDDNSPDGRHEAPSRLMSAYDDSEGGSYTQLFRDSEELKGTQNASRFYGTVGFPDETRGNPMQTNNTAAMTRAANCWKQPAMPLMRSAHGEGKASAAMFGKTEYEAYMDKINRFWYEGCDKFCGSIIEADDEAGKQAVVGVIGDGRPGHSGNRHRQVKVEEVNKTDTSEHAKPLFNMAIASMEWTLSQHGLQTQ
ncbi:hypothetical protein K4F52_000670 [Lecanicillium sp. MT-2017a]|nr:hypothetical protein K4F52_000670 [Lecanicillium sp. MT-2017a]